MKISVKTLILNLIIPTLLFLAVLIYSSNMVIKGDTRDKEIIEKNESQLIASEIQEFISNQKIYIENVVDTNIIQFVKSLPDRLDVSDVKNYYEIRNQLADEEKSMGLDVIYIASVKSKAFITGRDVDIPADYDPRIRPWFINTVNSKAFTVTGPYKTAENGGSLVLTISYPIFSTYDSDEIIGVIAYDIKMNQVISLLQKYDKQFPDKTITLWNGLDKLVVYNKNYSMKDNITIDQMLKDLKYSATDIEDFRRVFNETYISRNATISQNDSRISNIIPVKYSPLLLTVGFDKQAFTANIIKNNFSIVAVSVIFYIGFLVIAFIVMQRSVIKPINTTSKAFAKLSSADADLTIKIESKSKDEIEEMTKNFDIFVDNLREIIIKIKESTSTGNNISHDLTASVEQTAAAVNQIIANITSIQTQINNVDKSIMTTGSAVKQITENIYKLEKDISTQASMVEESSASITEMMASLDSVATITEKKTEAVEKLSQSAIRGKEQLELTNRTFAESVVSKMDSIQEMARTIETIANQTNLLSMNAAIEAAHAGEFGQGFAVVAEEIRKLADSSAKSSKEISLILKSVTSGVEETGKSAAATGVEFEKILNEVNGTKDALIEINANTRELTAGGSEIIKAIQELNTATSNIKLSSSEISENSRQILTEQQNMSNISSLVTGGTSEIQQGSSEIGSAMQLVSDLNLKLKDVVSSIKEVIDKFKV